MPRDINSILATYYPNRTAGVAAANASVQVNKPKLYSASEQAQRENNLANKAEAYWIPDQAHFFVSDILRQNGPKLWRAEIKAAAKAVMLDRHFKACNLSISVQRDMRKVRYDLKPYVKAALEALQPDFFDALCICNIVSRPEAPHGMHIMMMDMSREIATTRKIKKPPQWEQGDPYDTRVQALKGMGNCMYVPTKSGTGGAKIKLWCDTHKRFAEECERELVALMEAKEAELQDKADQKWHALQSEIEADIANDIAEITGKGLHGNKT